MPSFHLEYQLNANDLAEARRRWIFSPVLLVLIGGAIICANLIPQAIHPQLPLVNPPAMTPLSEAIFPWISWIVMLLIVWTPLIRVMRRLNAPPWRIPRQHAAAPSAIIFWTTVAFMIVGVIAAFVWTISSKRQAALALGPAVDPNFSPIFETLLPLFPLVLAMSMIPILMRRLLSPNRFWAGQYHLHRPFTTDIDDTAVRFAEPCASYHYTWPCFRGFNQTPNLFLLYPSALSFEIIPKRAFPNSQAAEQFADFLAQKIIPPTGGFPLASYAPIPVPPPTPDPLV